MRFLRLVAVAMTVVLLLATAALAQRTYDVDILAETFGFGATTRKSVELSDLHQVCPARDCIPSIDNPQYLSPDKATHISDDDLVITLAYKGDFYAFPAFYTTATWCCMTVRRSHYGIKLKPKALSDQ